MSELEKDRIILELQKRVNKLEGKDDNGIPTYSFSKITENELFSLVDIHRDLNDTIFDTWFHNNIEISDETVAVFVKLIKNNIQLIKTYNEEDLKVNMIIPILNRIEFKSFENEFRDFYELPLTYKTENYTFTGTTDFVVSKGLFRSKKPYFFIQEFKKGKVNTDPEPQLLAELISAIELNNELSMRGAYIVGENWNFVILEKLGKNRYRYFVSRTFNSTNIEDLKEIYKNLIFVKKEIIEMIKGTLNA